MMSPKSITRWQLLKDKTKNGRTVSEEIEYQKLSLKRKADEIAIADLEWKAELGEAFLNSVISKPDRKNALEDVLNSEINEKSRPFSGDDVKNFVKAYIRENKPSNKQNSNKKDDEIKSGHDTITNDQESGFNFDHRHNQN